MPEAQRISADEAKELIDAVPGGYLVCYEVAPQPAIGDVDEHDLETHVGSYEWGTAPEGMDEDELRDYL